MTGSQTVRNAARELYREAAIEDLEDDDLDADPADEGVSEAEYRQFFELLSRITDDRPFAGTRADQRGDRLRRLADEHDAEGALDEVLGWFD